MYDLIIIGMGPAGITASIYAKRTNLNTLVLEKDTPGGLLNKIKLITNYPGFSSITGPELSYKMFEQITSQGINYKIEEVTSLSKENDIFTITTNKNTYKSKSVLISTGRTPVKLQDEITKNLNLSKCTLCDAPLYKGKDVLVLTSLPNSLIEIKDLSTIVNNLTIITNKDLEGDPNIIKELKSNKNITILENTSIDSIDYIDNKYIIKYNDKTIKVDGVFTYLGYTKNTYYLNNLNITLKDGYIITNNYQTNIEGLYACGDIIKKELYQIVSATYDGATSIQLINKYINKRK